MSKITLEPNSSGAGTFSIVSPDSNINRTLNLPDEAGKLLSTGNNDPAEVFKQSNILGTVSESGGVPTGAIIERGSNSNGEFVKYADGTMICMFIEDVRKLPNFSTPNFSFTHTLPATFINSFYHTHGAYGTTRSDQNPFVYGSRSAGSPVSKETTFDIINCVGIQDRLSHVQITWIGRWY